MNANANNLDRFNEQGRVGDARAADDLCRERFGEFQAIDQEIEKSVREWLGDLEAEEHRRIDAELAEEERVWGAAWGTAVEAGKEQHGAFRAASAALLRHQRERDKATAGVIIIN